MAWISTRGSSSRSVRDFLTFSVNFFQISICIGVSKMSDASFPAARLAPEASDSLVKNEAQNIFTSFLSALHDSRRLQAGRILRQHAHLIAPSEQPIPHGASQNSESR